MAKYLDSTGLTYLWAKIKAWVGTYTNISNGTINVGSNSITPLTSHQDISGKADKSEMSVSTSGDQTTITLKSGTSATVLNSHQDISGKANKSEMDISVDDRANSTTITLKTGTSTTYDNVSFASYNDDPGLYTLEVGLVGAKVVTKDRIINGYPLEDDVTLTKSDVGLGNVTNDAQVKRTEMGANSGVATLDSSGKIPTTQLPSGYENAIDNVKVNGTALTITNKAVDIPLADGSTDGAMSSTDYTKLSGIATGAEVNQNAYGKIKAGSSSLVTASDKTDTLTLLGDLFQWYSGSTSGVRLVTNGTTQKQIGTIVDSTTVSTSWSSSTGKDNILMTLGALDAILPTIHTSTALTGTPTAPTATAGTNTTQIATTAFVTSAVSAGSTAITNLIGAASGICPLDANTKIDSQYLPSYVDDVIEAYARTGQTALTSTWLATGSASGTVITPEAGKIYVLMADSGDYTANSQFRWGGTAYVKLNDGGVSAITTTEIDAIVAN